MLTTLKQNVGDWLQEMLVKELEAQGHVATGDLKESIEVSVVATLQGWEIRGEFVYYGRYVDTGRKAGVKRVPIDALIKWINDKKINLNGKSEESVAFAIQASIFKKGIPTDGDERKKRWMSRTLEVNGNELQERIQRAMFEYVDIEFTNLIERTKAILNDSQANAA